MKVDRTSEILTRIVGSFENVSQALPAKNRLHWYLRRYRITGDQKYIPLINIALKELKPKIVKTLKVFSSEESVRKSGEKSLSLYKPNSERKQRRLWYYQKQPETPIYIGAVLYLFLIKSLHLEFTKDFSEVFFRSVDFLKSKKIWNLFLNDDFIRVNPSECANVIYNSAFLGIFDYRDELQKKSEDFWRGVNPKDPSVWLDKIYALTHLIIAASNYYQNFVNREEYKWIFKYFESDYQNILSKANVDSIGEMALCFKLSKVFNSMVIEGVQDFLVSKYDTQLGYIPNDRNPKIMASEHRNIIASMVLSNFDYLHKGPNLLNI